MRVAIIPDSPTCLGNTIFISNDVRDNGYSHYRAIRRVVEEEGGSVDTYDRAEIDCIDKVIVFNFSAFPEMALEAISAIGNENVFAIVLEPPGVWAAYYDRDIIASFGAYSLPVTGYPDLDNIYLGFPSAPVDVEWCAWESKKLLVSITSCKLYRFEGGLHEERILAIKHFQRSLADQFDMYGHGWKSDRFFGRFSPHRIFPSYRGPVASKHEAMRHYKFSLCYENTSTCAGYVSEKIFDSMQSGCVPIYLGAPDIESFVPEACFVDRRKFRSDREVESFIRSVSRNEYETHLDAIRAFLASEQYTVKLPMNYAKRIYGILKAGGRREPVNREGMRKLSVISALKMLRSKDDGKNKKGLLLFLKHAGWKDWLYLANQMMRSVLGKIGWRDIDTYVRMRRL